MMKSSMKLSVQSSNGPIRGVNCIDYCHANNDVFNMSTDGKEDHCNGGYSDKIFFAKSELSHSKELGCFCVGGVTPLEFSALVSQGNEIV